MSTPFAIRAAEAADIPVITDLLNALNVHEGYNVVTRAEDLQYALFSGELEVKVGAFVAVDGAQVVAVMMYYVGYDMLSSCTGYHLADVIVADGYRRQGIGRALFLALAAQALQKNKKWISLTALQKNVEAQGFYASLGLIFMEVNFMAIGARAMQALINPK